MFEHFKWKHQTVAFQSLLFKTKIMVRMRSTFVIMDALMKELINTLTHSKRNSEFKTYVHLKNNVIERFEQNRANENPSQLFLKDYAKYY